MIEQYFAELQTTFEKHANPATAAGARAYMRNLSEYYGLTSPLRRKLTKEFIAKSGYPPYEQLEEMVRFAWEQPQREWQYVAMEIVEKSVKKADQSLLDLAEWMITNKSWWDSVDFIAPNIAGVLFKRYPEIKMQYIEKWMQSENLWLQRSCLLHQLRDTKTTDRALLFNLCERLSDHPDFFIRKAIGWSLRQYSKVFPEAVIDFVNSHKLSNLSRKEALKVITRNG
ncbi:MAG: DNA alkylation repair protein [Bacteroidales bacterium]|nr:DNA alkylation repair protein [Bacteroidales bacterium]